MITHVSEPIQLSDVARVGTLSPYHFHRVFREITSTTPARFLTSLRMTEARHLLLATSKSVTDICTEVGYSSLGTFISQFGRLNGLSPRRFRAVMARIGDIRMGDLTEPANTIVPHGTFGSVSGPKWASDCALFGMYRADRAKEWPSVFKVIDTDRVIRTPPVADGEYEPIAVGFSREATLMDVLSAPIGTLGLVGFACSRLVVKASRSTHPFRVTLRRQRLVDPPVEFARQLLELAEEVTSDVPTHGPRSA